MTENKSKLRMTAGRNAAQKDFVPWNTAPEQASLAETQNP